MTLLLSFSAKLFAVIPPGLPIACPNADEITHTGKKSLITVRKLEVTDFSTEEIEVAPWVVNRPSSEGWVVDNFHNDSTLTKINPDAPLSVYISTDLITINKNAASYPDTTGNALHVDGTLHCYYELDHDNVLGVSTFNLKNYLINLSTLKNTKFTVSASEVMTSPFYRGPVLFKSDLICNTTAQKSMIDCSWEKILSPTVSP